MTAPMLTENRVDTPNAAVTRQAPDTKLCRDVYEGSAIVLGSEARRYLPQAPGEKTPDYMDRVNRSVYYNGFERTVGGLVGMVYRRNPELSDDVPKIIAGDREKNSAGGHWENIDLAGTHGDVFLRQSAEHVMVDGHAGILVDYPIVGEEISLGEERARGLRPYWCHIRKDQIVSFRVIVENGKVLLSQVVLLFKVMEPKGEFGEECIDEYRVYRREGKGDAATVLYSVWRKDKDNKLILTQAPGVIANQTEIPLVISYGPRKRGPLDTKPPLLDLAHYNLAHLRVKSDHLYALHKASIPVAVRKGANLSDDVATGEAVVIGVNTIIDVPVEGDFFYREHSGAALGASRTELEDLKADMAALGLAMLQRDTRAAETARGKQMDKSASDSALAVFARNNQDAAEHALGYHAKFLKLPTGGSVTINRDFESLMFDALFIQTLSNLVAAGQLSMETMWDKLAEGEVLPEDFDAEEEKRQIAEDAMNHPDPAMTPGDPNADPAAPPPDPLTAPLPKAA
jgi:hypothetical protein